MLNPNEQIRNEAVQFLEISEQFKEFPFVLMQIFTTTQSQIHKFQSALSLKSYINTHWNKRRRSLIDKISLDDGCRAQIRMGICQILAVEYQKKYREAFNDCIMIIARSNMSNCTKEFTELMNGFLQKVTNDISSGTFTYSQENYGMLRTIKKVYSEKCKRQNFRSPESFNALLTETLPNFMNLWNYIYQDITVNNNTSEVVFKYSNAVDGLLIWVLRTGPLYNMTDAIVTEYVVALLKKLELILSLFKKFEDAGGEEENYDLGKIIEKNCITLTYEFSQLVNVCPLAFHTCLPDY